jgi:predicted ATPase/DNA-binding SARP family transcriptional activator
VEIQVLGELEVLGAAGPVSLRAHKHRQLLAALTVRVGETRSVDELIDALWGPAPPPSAAKLLQVYVSQLRRLLPAGAAIRTRGFGYALDLGDATLDAQRFERLLADGEAALREGNPGLAGSVLRRALSLWHGGAYGELAYEEFARAEAERLDELRLRAHETRVEADLATGRHGELVGELQALAAAHPLRERIQVQLMLCLYRCGRQTEALEVYSALRAGLVAELGLQPGPELRELHRRILQQDPTLAFIAQAEARTSSLPSPPNRLIGREREVRDLRELLMREDVRMLVLTGAGGSGKTRLALGAARDAAPGFASGAAFVSLAPVRDPRLVVPAICRTLGVKEGASGESLGALAAALRRRELLLLLDNAEHLRASAHVFVELLAAAPHLTLLITSRVVLHLSGEHVYPVEPLPLDAAVALFQTRAREAGVRLRPGAEDQRAIERICERVDRLPLGVELAAGRTRILSPGELLDRLKARLPLLTNGPRDLPARQKTIRATIEWSYGLLDTAERRVLARLGVFVDGFTLDSAQAVCGATLGQVASLVDHHLVGRVTTSSGSRYRMLETIGEFALERLGDNEVNQVRDAHAEYFLALAEAAEPELRRVRESAWNRLLRAEHPNVAAALAWTADSGQVQLGLRIASALWFFWLDRDYLMSGDHWLSLLLGRPVEIAPAIRAKALLAAANVADVRGDRLRAERHALEALDLCRALHDDAGVAWALLLSSVGNTHRGEHDQGRRKLEEALPLHRSAGDELGARRCLQLLGNLSIELGDYTRARRLLEEVVESARAEGNLFQAAAALHSLADAELEAGATDRAIELYEGALAASRELGAHRISCFCLAGLGAALAVRGEAISAAKLWYAVLELEQMLGFRLRSRTRYERRIQQSHSPPSLPTATDPELVIEEALSACPPELLLHA